MDVQVQEWVARRAIVFRVSVATTLTLLALHSLPAFPSLWPDLSSNVLYGVSGLVLIPTSYFGWKDWRTGDS